MPLTGLPAGSADQLVINPAFAGLVSALSPSDLGLNAHDLFPVLTFTSNGNGMGYFVRYNLSDRMRLVADELLMRRPGAGAHKTNQERRLQTFQVSQRHLDAVVPDQLAQVVRAQTGGADDPAITEVLYVRELMLLNKEMRAAQLANDPNAVAGTLTPAAKWDDYTNSDPIADIQNAMMAVRSASGLTPNSLALPWDVALKLAYHPRFRVGVFATGSVRPVTETVDATPDGIAALLKAVLRLDNVYILRALYNGQAIQRNPQLQLQSVWGKNAYVFYKPQTPEWTRIMWAVDAVDTFYTGGIDTATVFTFYDPDKESTIYRVREDSDFVLLNPEVAFRLENVIS